MLYFERIWIFQLFQLCSFNFIPTDPYKLTVAIWKQPQLVSCWPTAASRNSCMQMSETETELLCSKITNG